MAQCKYLIHDKEAKKSGSYSIVNRKENQDSFLRIFMSKESILHDSIEAKCTSTGN